MTRTTRRTFAVAAALALLAAGCGDDDDGADVAAETTTTEATDEETTTTDAEAEEEPSEEPDEGGAAQAIEVAATDFAFDGAPAELEAGVVELSFTNDGEVAHEFALVEIGDTSVDDFVADFPPVLEGGPFPAYAEAVAVAGEAEPGEGYETTLLVAEGEYVLFCALDAAVPEEGATETTVAEEGGEEGPTGPIHFTLGMVQPLSISGGDEAELPEADGTIVAKDYGFDVDVQAGEQTVAFTNDGPDQVHHAVFFPFAEGVDEAAAEAALTTFLSSEGEGPPPPELDFAAAEGLKDTGIFSAGLGQTVTETFESGRTYAVVCFLQDRTGGPPHVVANGMQEIFTVE